MPMIARRIAVLATTAALLTPIIGHAGVYSDDLSKCLVARTSDEDKLLLAKWIFTVISAHPDTASLATVNNVEKVDVAKGTGKLFETLLTASCHDETTKAVKYEGSQALGAGFKVLGEIAMNTLLSNPKVQAESENFMQYVDTKKLEQSFAPSTGD